MEVIPPTNLQSTSAAPIPPVNVPPESEKKENFFDFIKSSIFEIFLVLLFSIIILTTFNYFNLIPLSSVFPALSFLPQQQNNYLNSGSQDSITFFNSNFTNLSACNYSGDKNVIINTIVDCKKPFKVFNNGKDPMYSRVLNSEISSDAEMQVNFGLEVIEGKDYSPSGIMLGGGPDETRIFISYNNDFNSWGLNFLYGKTISAFEPLYQVYPGYNQKVYLSILISKDGKQLNFLLPNGLMKSYSLKESLYAKNGTIPSNLVVYPKSQVSLYSFNYYTPGNQ